MDSLAGLLLLNYTVRGTSGKVQYKFHQPPIHRPEHNPSPHFVAQFVQLAFYVTHDLVIAGMIMNMAI